MGRMPYAGHAGRYTREWDDKDDPGRSVVNGYTDQRKCVLVRGPRTRDVVRKTMTQAGVSVRAYT